MNADSKDDALLIERILSKDESALGLLYDRYHIYVYTLALRIIGNAPEAEDVTLDVFQQVWKCAAEYNTDRGRVLSWLTTMARSRAIDCRRKSVRRKQVIQPIEDQPTLLDVAGSPAENAYHAEHRRQIRAALGVLPETQRRAIELAYFEGMSHTEIAEALNEPLGTVKTRIRSGLATLRAELVSYM